MQPTVGRIVLYRLSEWDVKRLNEQEKRGGHGQRNPHHPGQELPFLMCKIWPDEYGVGVAGVNGQVFLDGNETLWVTSVKEGTDNGTWHWPERV